MFWSLVGFSGIALVVVVVVTAVAALLLGIGTLLSWIFAVTVWEATIVVTAATAGAIWLVTLVSRPAFPGELLDDPTDDDDEEPRFTIVSPPLPSVRSRRRRRR